MSVEATKTTPESYQLSPQESQFLETLKKTQGDIFETLDKKEVFHGLKEIPYTILREQLAEQQLLQLFPKSHQLRQVINQFDHEMAYFKIWYSDPIIMQRFADASGKTFDDAKEYLDNILATARIVPLAGKSSSRIKKAKINTSDGYLSGMPGYLWSQISSHGYFESYDDENNFLTNKKLAFVKPKEKGTGIHELSHIINRGMGEDQGSYLETISKTKLSHEKIGFLKLLQNRRWTAAALALFIAIGTHDVMMGNLKSALAQLVLFGITYRDLKSYGEYQQDPSEIHSRIMEIRYFLNKKPTEHVSRNEIVLVKSEFHKEVRGLLDLVELHKQTDEFINLINTSF